MVPNTIYWQIPARDNRIQHTFQITFLVCQPGRTSTHWFMFPDKEDIDDVDFVDIGVCKLPTPTSLGETKPREQSKLLNSSSLTMI